MTDAEIQKYVKDQITMERDKAMYNIANTSFHIHNGIDSPNIDWGNLANAPKYFSVAVDTQGTTAVNVFSQTNKAKFNITITGVFIGSKDNTGANITLSNNGTTVCVVAKGSSGVLTGATSLLNTTYYKQNPLTIVSSSGGNATLYMTFTP